MLTEIYFKASAPAVARLLRSAVASYEEKFDERVDGRYTLREEFRWMEPVY
ncbi:MAG: hypothetical protein R3B47_21920 [Bacteroidia bacterium]